MSDEGDVKAETKRTDTRNRMAVAETASKSHPYPAGWVGDGLKRLSQGETMNAPDATDDDRDFIREACERASEGKSLGAADVARISDIMKRLKMKRAPLTVRKSED